MAVLPDSRGRVVVVVVWVLWGIALGVPASCSPFKVDPRQSAGQARGARPPAGMCTRQEEEEEEEEEDQEEGEGEGGGAEKRAGALCFAFVLPSCCPRLLLPPLPPNHCKPRGPGSPTSKQELSLERVQKPDQLYCQSLIIVGDKIQMKCQTLKACVVATLQRILGIAQTRRSNVGNVIGLVDLGSTWSRMVWYVSGMI